MIDKKIDGILGIVFAFLIIIFCFCLNIKGNNSIKYKDMIATKATVIRVDDMKKRYVRKASDYYSRWVYYKYVVNRIEYEKIENYGGFKKSEIEKIQVDSTIDMFYDANNVKNAKLGKYHVYGDFFDLGLPVFLL